MSSGRTHDRITLTSLPILTGISLILTRNAELTLWVAGSFLFGGLMFGPDLDIHSNQSIRWGWLRWMWQPYRQAVPHRSALSHGPIIGTVCRLLYVGLWAILLALLYQSACYFLKWPMWTEVQIWKTVQQFVTKNYSTLLAIFVGLEIGSMSHYSADFVSSFSKNFFAEKKQPIDPSGSREIDVRSAKARAQLSAKQVAEGNLAKELQVGSKAIDHQDPVRTTEYKPRTSKKSRYKRKT